MTTAQQWVQGARPRTLPAALAPVIAGTAAADWAGGLSWPKALLALVVAVALQVGVNYANDYSDGIRGTDDDRVGPARLTGGGLASPDQVKRAAMAAFAVAALAGLVLALSTAWWLLLVGVACLAAGWFYTGGSRPYGYAGLGEVAVFVFFGLVATVGTTFVQVEDLASRAIAIAALAGTGVGALACAILVANNLRDIPTDRVTGKHTLAVRLGEARTRALFVALLALAPLTLVPIGALTGPEAALGAVCLPLLAEAARPVRAQARGRDLVPALASVALAELIYAVGLAIGLTLTR